MNHSGHIEEIAKQAAAEYGQNWRTLNGWTKDIWREAVRHARPNTEGRTDHEKCAIKAVEAWYAAQASVPAPAPNEEAPVETPATLKKRGK